MDVILTSGLFRSASTWSYNVCRLLCELTAKDNKLPVIAHYADLEAGEKNIADALKAGPGYYVIKSHAPSKNVLDLIHTNIIKNVYTIRDPRDCVTSHANTKSTDFDDAVKYMEYTLRYLPYFFQFKNTLVIRYEDMVKDPKTEVKRIADYILGEVSDERIEKIHQATSLENMKQLADTMDEQAESSYYQDQEDKVHIKTLIHENHIQSGKQGRWREELTEAQQTRLNQTFKAYLLQMGYETEASMKALTQS